MVLPGATVDARLGQGADWLGFTHSYAGPDSRFDLGPGEDGVGFEDFFDEPGAGDTSLLVDLTRDHVSWHGVSSTLSGAELVRGAAKRIVLLGDPGRNGFSAHGCDVLKGGAGDDSLGLSSQRYDIAPDIKSCATSRLRAYGNAGDDRLRGGRRHDALIGGRGFDVANGGPAGRDRCEAERTWGKGCTR